MDDKIFFSYGHDNCQKYISKIKEYLEEAGFKVFLDTEILRAGKDWEYKLERAIEESKKVVFFITPHSARRPDGYCLNELALALSCKKEIIPVMLVYERPPLSIARLQFFDMQDICQKDDPSPLLKEKSERLIKILKDIDKLDFEGAQTKLIKNLNPIDFRSDFAKHKHFVGREWVIDRVNKWLEESKSSTILWISGEAGYGKSAIAAFLARRHPDVAGVYFCSYDSEIRNDPFNFVKTTAFYLQSQIEGYFEKIKDIEIESGDLEKLFRDLIINPLIEIKESEKNYILVLDGLDEALSDKKMGKEFAKMINSSYFKYELPNYIKIIITSRRDPNVSQILDGFNHLKLRVEEEENIKDCKEFIKLRLRELGYEDKIEGEKLIDTILKKSEGNMLYLNQLFMMIDMKTFDIDEYEKFPNTLNGIYMRFFERIAEDEEEYDRELAPLLEVIVAYRAPIPKILLGDILSFGKKKLKRVLNRLASMIEEDEGYIELYHKSLRDWLVMDENEKYMIDIEEGEKKIEEFLDSLDRDSYKEEYLEFFELNRKLVDRIYEKDGSLDRFFELLESKDKEEVLDLLHRLGYYYNEYNEMAKAISLRKKALNIVKPLYQKDKKRWAEYYTTSLNNLASSFYNIGEVREAIELFKEALEIRKELYKKDKDRWAEYYTGTLNNLASSLKDIGEVREAIELLKEALEIRKKLYQKDKDRWAEYYTGSLNNLALSLKDIGEVREAIELEKEALEITKELYQKDKDRWAEDYTRSLNNLASSFYNIGEVREAIELFKEALEIRKKLYQKDKDRWAEYYTTSLNNLASSLKRIGEVKEAIELEKEAVLIIKDKHKKYPKRWEKFYKTYLGNLLEAYEQEGMDEEALMISLELLKLLIEIEKENE